MRARRAVAGERRAGVARRMRVRAAALLAVSILSACGKGEGPRGSAGDEPATGGATTAAAAADRLQAAVVTEVPSGTGVEAVPDGPLVVASRTAVVADGRALAAITAGEIDPATRDGHRVRPLATWAEAWAAARGAPGAPVLIAVEPTLPSVVVLQLVSSIAAPDRRAFALVVRTSDGPRSVPLRLPDGEAAPTADAEPPLDLTLSLAPDRAFLWSGSGQEGTLASPLVTVTPDRGDRWRGALRERLTEIVTRRWHGRTRPPGERAITLLVAPDLATADLVAALVAVRHGDRGEELFPDVRLGLYTAPPVAEARDAAPPPRPVLRDDRALDEASRYAAILTFEGDDGEDGLTGSLDRRPGADLADQLADLRAAGGEAGGGLAGRDDTPPARGDRPPAADNPPGRITVVDRKAWGDSTLTADAVQRRIQATYLGGLRRCWKAELARDPTLTGRLVLDLTVTEAGRVAASRVQAPTPDLVACVRGLVASWRFDVPRDADGDVTEASFQLTFDLRPA